MDDRWLLCAVIHSLHDSAKLLNFLQGSVPSVMESKINVIVDPGIFMYIRIELLRPESSIL